MRDSPSPPRPAWEHVVEVALLVALLLAIWQLLHHVAGDVAMSAPIDTIRYTVTVIGSKEFRPHFFTTGTAFVVALLIVTVGGTLIGAMLGFWRLSGEVAEPVLVSLYSIPKVILYPVVLLFFGIGIAAEAAFGVLYGIVPVILMTMNAVRNVKPVFIRTARVFGLSSSMLMRTVLIPAALPEIFAGVRIGVSATLLGTILSEMFGSKRGLGFLLMAALGINDVQAIMSLALIMTTCAAVMNTLLLAVEHRLYRQG
jgi:NitT/TauT family transport system permease protein